MINEVIDLINNNLNDIVFDQIVLGIVSKVYRQAGESIEYMPGIIKEDGDIIYAGIDDIKSLMIYHKVYTANLNYNPKFGYGDSKYNEDSFNLNCFVIWDMRKIFLQNADMLLLIKSKFPQQIKASNNQVNVDITPNSAIFNSKQIFDSEYGFDKQYLIPPFINFIQLNYTAVIRYSQQCINDFIKCKK